MTTVNETFPDDVAIEFAGKIDVNIAEMNALKQGFLVKKVAMGKCPSKGQHIAVYCGTDDDFAWLRCQVYFKEMIGHGVPKAYRLIFGRWPG